MQVPPELLAQHRTVRRRQSFPRSFRPWADSASESDSLGGAERVAALDTADIVEEAVAGRRVPRRDGWDVPLPVSAVSGARSRRVVSPKRCVNWILALSRVDRLSRSLPGYQNDSRKAWTARDVAS